MGELMRLDYQNDYRRHQKVDHECLVIHRKILAEIELERLEVLFFELKSVDRELRRTQAGTTAFVELSMRRMTLANLIKNEKR